MPSFQTRSTARKSMLTVHITFLVMFVLAFLGLTVAVITWLFFEGVLLFSYLLCLFCVGKTHWELDFQRDCLFLTNTGNGRSYVFENLTQADLVVTQSKTQLQKDSCDLKLRNTPFGIYDVQQCRALMAYLQQTLPQ